MGGKACAAQPGCDSAKQRGSTDDIQAGVEGGKHPLRQRMVGQNTVEDGTDDTDPQDITEVAGRRADAACNPLLIARGRSHQRTVVRRQEQTNADPGQCQSADDQMRLGVGA